MSAVHYEESSEGNWVMKFENENGKWKIDSHVDDQVKERRRELEQRIEKWERQRKLINDEIRCFENDEIRCFEERDETGLEPLDVNLARVYGQMGIEE